MTSEVSDWKVVGDELHRNNGAVITGRSIYVPNVTDTTASVETWARWKLKVSGKVSAHFLQQWAKAGRPLPACLVGINPTTGEQSPNLLPSFWSGRRELGHVRQAAHSRGVSPDAVLGAVLGRASVLTPPWVGLPNPVGNPATLDLIGVSIGPSGSGKSAGMGAGADLLPIPIDDGLGEMPLGSGEGLIEAFHGPVMEEGEDGKKRPVRRQVKRGILFEADEGQVLAELGGRKGSTLMPTLRSAWSGSRLGQANASAETRRHLAPASYRFVLNMGIQTEHATALLDDAAGGTPQRLLFLAATDPTIPDVAPAWPGPLAWKPQATHPRTMGLDVDVSREIRTRALQRGRGEIIIDPLDAHRDLLRLKVAGLLAILAGRLDIDADDWRLAGDVVDASDRVRATIIAAAQERAAVHEQGAVRKLISRNVAVSSNEESRALDAWAKAIGRHVARGTCDGGCKRRCLSRAVPGKHRDHVTIDDAIEEAIRLGWVVTDGDTYRPGSSRPVPSGRS